MKAMKLVTLGLLSAVCCAVQPAWVAANDMPNSNGTATGTAVRSSNDKVGTNTDPTYTTPKGGQDQLDHQTTEQRSKESDTTPSGKRHRTRRRAASETSKTINAGDVTPSK